MSSRARLRFCSGAGYIDALNGRTQALQDVEKLLSTKFSRPFGTNDTWTTPRPNVETLGYCRASLRDESRILLAQASSPDVLAASSGGVSPPHLIVNTKTRSSRRAWSWSEPKFCARLTKRIWRPFNRSCAARPGDLSPQELAPIEVAILAQKHSP